MTHFIVHISTGYIVASTIVVYYARIGHSVNKNKIEV